jgi:hypothetical protein
MSAQRGHLTRLPARDSFALSSLPHLHVSEIVIVYEPQSAPSQFIIDQLL